MRYEKIDLNSIRKICLKYSKNPKFAFNIKSNLCWNRYKKQVVYLAKLIPKNATALEAGCGQGICSTMLRKLRPDISIKAIELYPYGDADSKYKYWSEFKKLGVKFQIDNAESMKFKNNTFDVVFCFGVIEHLNAEKFLSEAYRVLKKDGQLFIFNIPNKYSIAEYMSKKIKIYFHPKKYTTNEIKNLIEDNGFKIISIRRRFVIPSQLNMLGGRAARFSNSSYKFLDKLDILLIKIPFINYFSQSIELYARKSK